MRNLIFLSLILFLSACGGGWTEEDKKQMRDDCVRQSRTQISEEQTNKYCDCFVEQIVKTYPVFNDMLDNYKSDTVEKLKEHCRREIGLQ